MIIQLNDTVLKIKEDFRKIFPGLKIEFYGHAHGVEEGSEARDQLTDETRIKDISTSKGLRDIAVDPEWSVGHFEQLMEKECGLHVQVFRKSNALWLQTSATDHWTLKEQNRKGLASVQ